MTTRLRTNPLNTTVVLVYAPISAYDDEHIETSTRSSRTSLTKWKRKTAWWDIVTGKPKWARTHKTTGRIYQRLMQWHFQWQGNTPPGIRQLQHDAVQRTRRSQSIRKVNLARPKWSTAPDWLHSSAEAAQFWRQQSKDQNIPRSGRGQWPWPFSFFYVKVTCILIKVDESILLE